MQTGYTRNERTWQCENCQSIKNWLPSNLGTLTPEDLTLQAAAHPTSPWGRHRKNSTLSQSKWAENLHTKNLHSNCSWNGHRKRVRKPWQRRPRRDEVVPAHAGTARMARSGCAWKVSAELPPTPLRPVSTLALLQARLPHHHFYSRFHQWDPNLVLGLYTLCSALTPLHPTWHLHGATLLSPIHSGWVEVHTNSTFLFNVGLIWS